MKKIIISGLIGLPIGIMWTVLILFFESVAYGSGKFIVGVPGFVEKCGSEVSAMGIQLFVSAVFGFIIGSASSIWRRDDWSLLKQTILHFIILSFTFCGAGLICWWMPRTVFGVLSYFAIMLLIYIVIWVIMFFATRRQVKEINKFIEK